MRVTAADLVRTRPRPAAVAVVLALLALLVPLAASSASAMTITRYEDQILTQANAVRVAKGKAALSLNSCLDSYANAWAKEIAKKRKLVHRSTASLKLIMGKDRCNLRQIGENLASGQTAGTLVVGYVSHSPSDACLKRGTCSINWMRSQGHRDNLLGTSYRRTGVGAAVDSSGRYYSVQMYGTPR